MDGWIDGLMLHSTRRDNRQCPETGPNRPRRVFRTCANGVEYAVHQVHLSCRPNAFSDFPGKRLTLLSGGQNLGANRTENSLSRNNSRSELAKSWCKRSIDQFFSAKPRIFSKSGLRHCYLFIFTGLPPLLNVISRESKLRKINRLIEIQAKTIKTLHRQIQKQKMLKYLSLIELKRLSMKLWKL